MVCSMLMINIMVIIVKIILVLGLAILILLLLILLIPIHYSLSASIHEKQRLNVSFRWAIFQVALLFADQNSIFQVNILGRRNKVGPIKKTSQKQTKQPAKKSVFKPAGLAFFKAVLSFSKESLGLIKPQRIVATGSYNLDDPALTALTSMVVNLLIALVPGAEISLSPDFESNVNDMELIIAGRLFLILFVGLMLKYIVKKEVREVLFQKRIAVKSVN
jgi:hypothetical protein